MDLPISEGGEGLSGGQRQLVALARVFINQPRIWLLDEPTASLDREMEERVWQALEANPCVLTTFSSSAPIGRLWRAVWSTACW
jgi:ABC-type bacteriocin/lantibiotic exporter with double-glycine peptidase domain